MSRSNQRSAYGNQNNGVWMSQWKKNKIKQRLKRRKALDDDYDFDLCDISQETKVVEVDENFRPFDILPNELLVEIIEKLSPYNRHTLSQVSRRMYHGVQKAGLLPQETHLLCLGRNVFSVQFGFEKVYVAEDEESFLKNRSSVEHVTLDDPALLYPYQKPKKSGYLVMYTGEPFKKNIEDYYSMVRVIDRVIITPDFRWNCGAVHLLTLDDWNVKWWRHRLRIPDVVLCMIIEHAKPADYPEDKEYRPRFDSVMFIGDAQHRVEIGFEYKNVADYDTYYVDKEGVRSKHLSADAVNSAIETIVDDSPCCDMRWTFDLSDNEFQLFIRKYGYRFDASGSVFLHACTLDDPFTRTFYLPDRTIYVTIVETFVIFKQKALKKQQMAVKNN